MADNRRNPLAPTLDLTARIGEGNPLAAGTPSLGEAIARSYDLAKSKVAEWHADDVAQGFRDPVTGMPTAAGLRHLGSGYVNALLMGSTTPSARWFHGTANEFNAFRTPEVYITNDSNQAMQYAQGAHRFLERGTGTPKVLGIEPKPGEVRNIDNHLFDAMDEGVDLGEAIDAAVAAARKEGKVRYLEYSHPNAGDQGEHTVRVSLYPQEDLVRR